MKVTSVPDGIEHAQQGHLLEDAVQNNKGLSGDWNAGELLELQPAGKKRMTTAEFLRGHKVKLFEARFGPEMLS